MRECFVIIKYPYNNDPYIEDIFDEEDLAEKHKKGLEELEIILMYKGHLNACSRYEIENHNITERADEVNGLENHGYTQEELAEAKKYLNVAEDNNEHERNRQIM